MAIYAIHWMLVPFVCAPIAPAPFYALQNRLQPARFPRHPGPHSPRRLARREQDEMDGGEVRRGEERRGERWHYY